MGQKDSFASSNGLTLINLNPATASPFAHLSMTDLKSWVRSGQLTTSQAEGLCADWADSVLNAPAGATKATPYRRPHAVFFDSIEKVKSQCLQRVKADPRRFFDSDNHSSTWSKDISAGITLKTSELPVIDEIPVLNMLSASAGIRYNVSHTKQDSSSTGNSINVQNGKMITVETIPIRVAATDYEKCMVIRMDANLLFSDLSDIFREDLSLGEKLSVANRGYLVCWGQNSHRPLIFDEKYYILDQRPPETQAMDSSADLDRPFFVQLRGRRDFASFLTYVQGVYQVPAQYTGDYEETHMLADPAEAVFLRGLNSAPGQIVESQ
jgi:hypothetical protein